MEADKLSEESKQTLRDFGQKILDSYIQSYEISDVAEDGTVTAKVTYGFSPDAMNNIDASAVTKDLITNYTSEHMTELAEIYQKEGQEALTLKIVDDLLPDMLDALATAIDESPDATGTITLTLEETDNGWTVKKAEGDAPTSESTESTGSDDSSATSE